MSAGAAVVLQFPRRPPGAATPSPAAGGSAAIESLAESVRQLCGVVQQLVQIIGAARPKDEDAPAARSAPAPAGHRFRRRSILGSPRHRPASRKPVPLTGWARLLQRVREGRSVVDHQDIKASILDEDVSTRDASPHMWRAYEVLRSLAHKYARWYPDKPVTAFSDDIYKPLRNAVFLDGEEVDEYIRQTLADMQKVTNGNPTPQQGREVAMRAAAACVVGAVAVEQPDAFGLALNFIIEAVYWEGCLDGLSDTPLQARRVTASDIHRDNANKRWEPFQEPEAQAVAQWIQRTKGGYRGKKIDFARAYAQMLFNEKKLTVSARTIAYEWLKGK